MKVYSKRNSFTPEQNEQISESMKKIIDSNQHFTSVRKNKAYVGIFILNIILYSSMSVYFYRSLWESILFSCLGFLSIQLIFIVSHIWAHATMLEYKMWEDGSISDVITNIPSVLVFAFYHHHEFMVGIYEKIKFKNDGDFVTAFSHFETFSLLTTNSPIDSKFIYFYKILCLMVTPTTSSPFILWYEIGVILLPLSHGWAHQRKGCKWGIQYVFGFLEKVGIFAGTSAHHSHHIYDNNTIYKDFSSSGLYSKRVDKFFNKLWNMTFNFSAKSNSNRIFRSVSMHEIWYPIMTITMIMCLSLPIMLI